MTLSKYDQPHKISTGEKELKVGRATPIKFSNETDKKNPNSLRFLIGHLINFFFGGSRKKAVEAMARTSGRYASDRPKKNVKVMSVDALATILNDGDHSEYWHLEAIAKSVRIPSSALLSLSRTYSFIRDGNIEAAMAFAAGHRSLAAQLEGIIHSRTLAKDSIENIASGFEEMVRLEEGPKLWDVKSV